MSSCRDLPRIPSPLTAPLDDNRLLVEWIAEMTDRPPRVVGERLHQEECKPGINLSNEVRSRGVQPHVWSDRLVALYQESDAFLYELVTWNRNPQKLQMRQWIAEYLRDDRATPLRILTFGDGLGFDSVHLSQCGHHVTFFEVSELALRFAKRVFDLSGCAVCVLEDQDEIADEAYDVIVCLDVLEHLPDPGEFVARFARYLCPGGRLVVHAPFFYLAPDTPTHLESNRRYSGDLAKLYAPHGFVLLDGCFFWDPLVLGKTGPGIELPRARPLWRFALRLSGLLLSAARYWCTPHCLVTRAITKTDSGWREDLESSMLNQEPTTPTQDLS